MSSQPRDQTCIFMSLALAGGFFTTSVAWEAPCDGRVGRVMKEEVAKSVIWEQQYKYGTFLQEKDQESV